MTSFADGHEPKGLVPLVRHYLSDVIYGANDGIITTFAVVSGVTGAQLEARIVLILGFANLLADGFSMGASNYLAIRSDEDVRATEGREPQEPFAHRHAIMTFGAFVIAGVIPLVSYLVLPGDRAFPLAVALTLACLFGVGAARSLVTSRSWYTAGAEMLFVGAVAAGVAYGVGSLVEDLVT
jgi:VIT1/CCC1 family predicted Fe2+/Mn2+ transporter